MEFAGVACHVYFLFPIQTTVDIYTSYFSSISPYLYRKQLAWTSLFSLNSELKTPITEPISPWREAPDNTPASVHVWLASFIGWTVCILIIVCRSCPLAIAIKCISAEQKEVKKPWGQCIILQYMDTSLTISIFGCNVDSRITALVSDAWWLQELHLHATV